MGRFRILMFAWALCAAPLAFGHNVPDHEDHEHDGVSVDVNAADGAMPLPIEITGEFNLVDHNGRVVSERDYAGRHVLVFFGYVNCKNMCSISLNRIGQAVAHLGPSADRLSPLVITVDPERDTPRALKAGLAKYHPGLIGLTGTTRQLERAYKNFNQHPVSMGTDWEDDPIVSHSSYIYLLDENGRLATLFPPVLNPRSMADIILKYLNPTS